TRVEYIWAEGKSAKREGTRRGTFLLGSSGTCCRGVPCQRRHSRHFLSSKTENINVASGISIRASSPDGRPREERFGIFQRMDLPAQDAYSGGMVFHDSQALFRR